MIRPQFILVTVAILVTACTARTQSAAPRMLHLNQEPYVSSASGLCRNPTKVFGPHVFAEEYFSLVTSSDKPLTRDTLAVGSIVIKEKYVGGKLSVTTTMTKLDTHQNDTSWQYAMIDAQGHDITKAWRTFAGMECVDCHRKYQGRDYVSPVFWNYYQAALSIQGVGETNKTLSSEIR